MYYEEANVRKYTDSKGRPYYQIRLKKDSKLTDKELKVKPIALVDVAEIKEIAKSSNIKKFNELQANLNNTSEELAEVKQQLQEAKATVESLTSENEKLKEEKLQLQEDLITEKNKHKELIEAANNNVVEAKDKVIKLQEEHIKEIAELNSKLNNEKDFSKALLVAVNDLNKRNFFSRLINKEPDSVKKILELKPIVEIATDISENDK